jgi:tRNA threonylcarbamoyl adenosine modification protein (Sua5/YciO/YrdC/YwlC family)
MTSNLILFFLLLIAKCGVDAFIGKRHPADKNDIEMTRHAKTMLFGTKMKFRPPSKVAQQTEYIRVKADGEDAWKVMDCVEILEKGGLGVVPTETGYGFVCPLDSKDGIERMLRIKNLHRCKKPMSLLCNDLSSIDQYCFGIDRGVFKVLKKNLPGAYTFILPAKNSLPKQIIFDSKGKKHSWKRQTLGIRIPNDPVLRYLHDELLGGTPLLISSLPVDEEEERQLLDCHLDPDDSWCNDVDFIIDAGARPCEGSTIYDMTNRGEPELIREGIGNIELVV